MKDQRKVQRAIRKRRSARTRKALRVTETRPRLSIFRSLKHIYGQIIDTNGRILASASDAQLEGKKGKGVAAAKIVGKLLAEKAVAKKIQRVVFDKSHYKYHGRVRAFAEGAREGGLEF